ncbi:hypothetical protein EJ419_06370 [Alloscardovia theropitheci]|uniref:Sodium:proton antiporter n=1 Tax=Alloscardovia theropitheci TaxID=2496842 RepID=A0A4R0QNU8_9BIFI|nr:hypothetical protein [Alloscardovia theropitheci]TCD53873.1 hypothetical protein EJ419_06370 [Alloscardovia theropitheci]
MATFMKKSWREIIAAVATLAALIIVIVSGTTGFLAGNAINYPAIGLSILAVVALTADVALMIRGNKIAVEGMPSLRSIISDGLLIVSIASICAALAFLLVRRMPLVADIYFIPVNHPAAEDVAMNMTIAALVGYVIAVLLLIVESFMSRTSMSVKHDEAVQDSPAKK